MRDAAVAAINFSLSLMKGLIRQQISRLPFKCQAPIQLAASGRKAARVEQNSTIYNQSQKLHSASQPGVTSSGSLHCCGTRETLTQPLFDDFLNAAAAIVCFHSQGLFTALPPPPFLPSRSRSPTWAFSPKTPLPLVRIPQNGRQGVLYFLRTAESTKWIAVSWWNKTCLGSRWWMTACWERGRA